MGSTRPIWLCVIGPISLTLKGESPSAQKEGGRSDFYPCHLQEILSIHGEKHSNDYETLGATELWICYKAFENKKGAKTILKGERTSSISFFGKVTGLVDRGKVEDIIYRDVST